jgi:hypothetical protein
MTNPDGGNPASAKRKPDARVTTGGPWLPQSSFPV